MGGKTKTTQNTQQQSTQSAQQAQSSNYDNRNEIGFAQVPSWQGLEDLRNYEEQVDPRIAAMRGNRERQAMSAYGPAGAYSSPELQREQIFTRLGEISQDTGQQQREDAYNRNQAKGQRLGTIAQLSAPVSYNARSYGSSAGQGTSSGSMNSTGSSQGVTQGPGFFSQLGGAFAGALGKGLGSLIAGPGALIGGK